MSHPRTNRSMSKSPAVLERGAVSRSITYTDLINDVRKRNSNMTHLCYLPDSNTLTFNEIALDESFPLPGVTKCGLLVGKYDKKDGTKAEPVWAYAHDHIAHKGKKTQSITYFLFNSNRQLEDEEIDDIKFIKPFKAAYSMPGALFHKRVRLLILFYFMEKGLLEYFSPLTDDLKLFKAALASVSQVAVTMRDRSARLMGTLRGPGVGGIAKAAPFIPPGVSPFVKADPKDDNVEFLASVEKAPGANVSIIPSQDISKKNTPVANRLRPIDLIEAISNNPRVSSGNPPKKTFPQDPSSLSKLQGTKRSLPPTTIKDELTQTQPPAKRPLTTPPTIDDGVLTHFQAFVQHIRGNFTEEDHRSLQAAYASLKSENSSLKQRLEKAEQERDDCRKENEGLNDLKAFIMDMAESIRQGDKVREVEREMEERRRSVEERMRAGRREEKGKSIDFDGDRDGAVPRGIFYSPLRERPNRFGEADPSAEDGAQ